LSPAHPSVGNFAEELDRRQIARYALPVTIVAFLRRFLRKLQPPGNRGSLDTEYRQPNRGAMGDPGGPHPHSGLDVGGFGQ
jgi:hypothetical protein